MAGLSSAPRPHYTSHITSCNMSVTSLTCQCHDNIIIMTLMTPVQSVDKSLAVSLCFACLLGVVQMFIASETEKNSLVL